MGSEILYYAVGGGLGHLVRARAFLHMQGLANCATLLTASNFARDSRVVDGLDVVPVPPELERDPAAFRAWIAREIARLGPSCLCIDTFPCGLFGELQDFQLNGLQLWHIARLLRWRNYAPLVGRAPLRFDRCWRLEPLEREHQSFLDAQCANIADLDLPVTSLPPQAALPERYWLIVHSAPAAEVDDLIAYAHEIRALEAADVALVIITQSPAVHLPSAAFVLDTFPAHPYFAKAERIFTAAGFNLMRETESYQAKHTLLPMPRRFDDQFERARRAQRARTSRT